MQRDDSVIHVRGFAHHVDLIVQAGPNPCAEHVVIVNDRNPNHDASPL
jgi:hypothetical protein